MAFPVMTRLSRMLTAALMATAGLAIIILMLHTVVNALLRHVANSPMTGTTEMVGYWYVPLAALLGFYFAQRGGAQIEARLVFDRLPLTNRIELQLLGQVLTIALCVGFAHYGWHEAIEAYHFQRTAGVTSIVIWPVLFLVPLTFVMLAAQIALDLITVVRQRDPDATTHGHQQPDATAAMGD